jgi:hypothetical protein
VALLVASAVGGCASTPPAPQVGQTPEQVAEQQSNFAVVLQFLVAGTRFSVGEVYRHDPNTRESLIFIDGRFACSHVTEWTAPVEQPWLSQPDDLVNWRWVSQPDGLEYLAARLRGTCGLADMPPARLLTDAEVPIPEVPPKVADSSAQDSQQMNPWAQGAMETLFYTAGIVLSPIILAVGLPTLAVGDAMNHSVEGKRAKAGPGMSSAEAVKILGTPSARFNLSGSGTEVLAYIGGAMAVSGNWYVGVCDGRVIWTHRDDEWLKGLAGQAISQAK